MSYYLESNSTSNLLALVLIYCEYCSYYTESYTTTYAPAPIYYEQPSYTTPNYYE